MKRVLVPGLALVVLATLALSPTTAMGAGSQLDPAMCAPGTGFTAAGNEFFPLPTRHVWNYQGEEKGVLKVLRISVLGTERFFGNTVTTRVLEEKEWEDADGDRFVTDSELVERSLNYFAQKNGTVCYFGEDVDIYEDGEIVSHDGAWRADGAGNRPGIFMPANPRKGMRFEQEFAPDVAQDEATIVAEDRTIPVPAATFTDTISIREKNAVDGDVGFKDYASNVGLIVDGVLQLVSHG
jgi:hypothetical protein